MITRMRKKMKIIKKNQIRELEFSEKQLILDLKKEAKVLNLEQGAAELIAKEVAKNVSQWVADKTTITQSDLDRKIITEVRKYNKDLAFILGERNKII
jgi:hypothetical protein